MFLDIVLWDTKGSDSYELCPTIILTPLGQYKFVQKVAEVMSRILPSNTALPIPVIESHDIDTDKINHHNLSYGPVITSDAMCIKWLYREGLMLPKYALDAVVAHADENCLIANYEHPFWRNIYWYLFSSFSQSGVPDPAIFTEDYKLTKYARVNLNKPYKILNHNYQEEFLVYVENIEY